MGCTAAAQVLPVLVSAAGSVDTKDKVLGLPGCFGVAIVVVDHAPSELVAETCDWDVGAELAVGFCRNCIDPVTLQLSICFYTRKLNKLAKMFMIKASLVNMSNCKMNTGN
jgi:hypothetical protein